MTVTVAKIHHEGAGVPTDNLDRFAHGGYTLGIGRSPHSWKIFRPPTEDWSTLNLNGVVAGICLSGDRETWALTSVELANIQEGCQELQARRWLSNVPDVSPHDNLAGSKTECPGRMVYAAWPQVVAAVQNHGTHPLEVHKMIACPVPNAHPQARGPFAGRVPFVQVILQPDGTTDVCGCDGAKITNLQGAPAFGMWVCHLGKLNQPIGALAPLDANSLLGMAADMGTFQFDVTAIYD